MQFVAENWDTLMTILNTVGLLIVGATKKSKR